MNVVEKFIHDRFLIVGLILGLGIGIFVVSLSQSWVWMCVVGETRIPYCENPIVFPLYMAVIGAVAALCVEYLERLEKRLLGK
ncbi:MAG: hypothetical protein DRP11_05455 [Candidatus Aenigmatarchaeota archaeon]|nr:MAG: hypothetical protein DRP11_05455 [Candidatus Aenigmarchaeota archaeon]